MSDIKILYEDNHLLAVVKPVNMLSQGDSTNDGDILTLLKKDLKRRYNKPGNVYLGLVQRLDRPVGGVMVFAKTSKAASRLSEQIRRNEIHKIYGAVIHGLPLKLEGCLEHYLVKDRDTNITRVSDVSDKNSRKAVLEYVVLDYKGGLSLVKVNLITGRSHQIRVQFSTEGYPLYGDQKYGAEKNRPGQQIALWSSQLELVHPVKGEIMVFKSPPPDVHPWNIFGCVGDLFWDS